MLVEVQTPQGDHVLLTSVIAQVYIYIYMYHEVICSHQVLVVEALIVIKGLGCSGLNK